MTYPMVPFPMTLRDSKLRFQGNRVIYALDSLLCAQLTRDLFTIAKFLAFRCSFHSIN